MSIPLLPLWFRHVLKAKFICQKSSKLFNKFQHLVCNRSSCSDVLKNVNTFNSSFVVMGDRLYVMYGDKVVITYPFSTHCRPFLHGPHSGFLSPSQTFRNNTGEHWWYSASLRLQIPWYSSIVGSMTQHPSSPQSLSESHIVPTIKQK